MDDRIHSLWAQGSLPKTTAERPVARPEYAKDVPLPVGIDYFSLLFQRFFFRLSAGQKLDFQKFFEFEFPHDVRLASVCSGTDINVVIWHKLAVEVKSFFGVELQPEQVFAAEKHPDKQGFLRRMHPSLPTLYQDCLELDGESAFDVVGGGQKAIEGADVLTGGFPCTDGSGLNAKASSVGNRSCILGDNLRTGSVFRAIVRWVEKHSAMAAPQAGIRSCKFLNLENVTALMNAPSEHGKPVGPDNLTVAMHLLSSQINFHTKTFQLDPRLFGVPQSRKRLWLLSWARCELKMRGLCDDQADRLASGLMSLFVGSRLQDMCKYLLPDDDPKLVAHLQRMEAAYFAKNGCDSAASIANGDTLVHHASVKKRRVNSGKPAPGWIMRHIEQFESSNRE